jgi:hypothetical protein
MQDEGHQCCLGHVLGEAVAVGAAANVLLLRDIAGRLRMLAKQMESGKLSRCALKSLFDDRAEYASCR